MAFNNLTCKRLQCNEIWSFVGAKAKNVPSDKQGEFGFGDVWTWVVIDADTKLVPCWHVGKRDAEAAYDFINDLAARLSNRVQLSTDGHKPYLEAAEIPGSLLKSFDSILPEFQHYQAQM